MSTYNGEQYLKEQLNSIYQQKGVNFSLLVRDDGSSDGTKKILEYEASQRRLEWYEGDNLGPARSFMDLLQQAPSDSDFYAFSDQDDVWIDDKLSVAVQAIGETDSPALYFSSTRNVDETLTPLPQKVFAPTLTFGESLIRQYASGCTMVFNRCLRQLLLSYKPKFLYMHDMWVVSVALAVGARVHYDPIPHILYRQHQSNAVGVTNSLSEAWKKRISRFCKNEHIRSKTAFELLSGFGNKMTEENRRLSYHASHSSASWKSRLWLITNHRLWSPDMTVSITSRIAILANRF